MLAIPNGLPQETVDYLLIGSRTTILDGEDCEEAIVEAPYPAESNSNDSCRFGSNVVAPSQVGHGSKLPVAVVSTL